MYLIYRHTVNFKATVRHESPYEGRKFEGKEERLSWGWKEFARKDRICESNRGLTYFVYQY